MANGRVLLPLTLSTPLASARTTNSGLSVCTTSLLVFFSCQRGVAPSSKSRLVVQQRGNGSSAGEQDKVYSHRAGRVKEGFVRRIGLGCCIREEGVLLNPGRRAKAPETADGMSKRSCAAGYILMASACQLMYH